jgi:cytochrome c551/c552
MHCNISTTSVAVLLLTQEGGPLPHPLAAAPYTQQGCGCCSQEDRKALINSFMSMARKEVTKVNKLTKKAKGVDILVLRATVVHLEVA